MTSINQSTKADLIIELGMEELPPMSLTKLTESFGLSMQQQLESANLNFDSVETYSSSRRIAVIVKQLDCTQADSVSERIGPALQLAIDDEGNPSKAALGFARSCGVAFEELGETDSEPKKLLFQQSVKGSATIDLIQAMLSVTLEQLPIEKRMRWGSNEAEFVRPVHWLLALLNEAIIPCEAFGITSSNFSCGHRFHAPDEVVITNASNYVAQLHSAYVMVDKQQRNASILEQITQLSDSLQATPVYDDSLLEEVSALVEWPVALMGSFDAEFLEIPQQALISSMQSHQKYFPVVGSNQKLLPNFITIANIESTNPQTVIEGNERVIRPRLSDAVFFYQNDLNRTLNHFAEQLESFTFERKLGSMAAKVKRIESLACSMAQTLPQVDSEQLATDLKRAAQLCKADLLSDMVQEFPDLQGEMGGRYAEHQGENEQVSKAIAEHYFPRFSSDSLPTTITGVLLSLADRIDTLTGIFAIGKQPTGSRDPFALRRHSFAILKMIVETDLSLDLKQVVAFACQQFSYLDTANDELEDKVIAYLLDRLKSYFDELTIDGDVFRAIASLNITQPLDFVHRAKALMDFKAMPESSDLSQAHKRVNNILKKNNVTSDTVSINQQLLSEPAEQALFDAIQQLIQDLGTNSDYRAVLKAIASINNEVNYFFDNVMVMADDESLRNNRLQLLLLLNRQLSLVADIAELD